MRKVAILLLLLPLLTGCWDRLPLRKLQFVDIAGLDWNEMNREAELDYVITNLKSTGPGSGEPVSETVELKGRNVVDAISQGEYIDQAPFLGISTGIYLMSESFMKHDPISQLNFLLHAPYSSINTPVVVFKGDLGTFLKTAPKQNGKFTENFYSFNMALDKNSIIPSVTMMQFLQSKEDELANFAIPVVKQNEKGTKLDGALLFSHGKNIDVELNKEQLRMVMLLNGNEGGRQRYSGKLEKVSDEKNAYRSYSFSVKKGTSSIRVIPQSKKPPKVKINVNIDIYAFDLGKAYHQLDAKYVNKIEKVLGDQLDKKALETIQTMQKANCDLVGVGEKIKAFHPKIWKNLNWEDDYPKMNIKPHLKVHILNVDRM
ncbi:Ger(x)C family spore germination protein [Bacillus sp. AFS041924]|uniref:Ger(x)C family spore germination protein n=1 Tax=Bacillus sp. AFS041924 TaxID=2033503 RepID=UPI000BFB4227|nr:Ger(x)C family spore germination protein [Bacillus sp. AFS041924]PGS51671.1 spore gernimation protein GerC [Bacillus sp. AFS041924]